MTEERTPDRPGTMSELFEQASENLKKKGLDRQPSAQSNTHASAQLNRKLLDSLFFEQKLLDPVESDPGSTLFGTKMKMPVFCSALSRPPHLSDADMLEIVRGMGKAGTMMMLGMGSSELLKAAVATGTPVAKIVKAFRDTDLLYKKVQEVEEQGCVAVGIDIDYWHGTFRDGAARGTETYAPRESAEIRQLIASTKLPFIIKGVLSIDDARKSAELGASAVIVSNHLWVTLDFGKPSIIALPQIAQAVGDKLTVLVDSGFKTGNDVFKAIALGAKGVGITSSVVTAVSAGGSDGVEQFLGFIHAELKRTMTFCGCPDISSISESALVASPEIRPWW